MLSFYYALNRYERLLAGFLFENHFAINQCKQGVVFAHPNIVARIMYGASLSYNNIACDGHLTAKNFYAKALAMGFATVA